jgi:prevent-host-death family protein
MTMVRISIAEASERLPELIEAARRGEVVIISQAGRDVVQLAPLAARRRRQFGSAQGRVVLAPDFEAPLDDFVAYHA